MSYNSNDRQHFNHSVIYLFLFNHISNNKSLLTNQCCVLSGPVGGMCVDRSMNGNKMFFVVEPRKDS
uniref:Uncharacterized protein n=1 Tax=Anguilla anguilla TaxID=7936 RepID=A0A0E9SYH0_ANGAN